MRRSDREVIGLENLLGILERCEILRLGLCADNQPYIVPMNFAYETVGEKLFIYLHCASSGRKIEMMRHNDNVCFEADCSYKTVEGDIACKWSAEFESIMGEGKASILLAEQDKTHGLDLLMKRYGFEGKPAYTAKDLSVVTVVRIEVSSLTGKRKV